MVLAALVAGAPAHWNCGDSGDGDGGGDGGGGHRSYHCKQRVAFQGMQGHCPAGRKAGPASLEAAEWCWSLPVLARTLGEGQVHLGWQQRAAAAAVAVGAARADLQESRQRAVMAEKVPDVSAQGNRADAGLSDNSTTSTELSRA